MGFLAYKMMIPRITGEKMIYVSSSCLPHKDICKSVISLARAGFLHIELSGGGSVYNPDLLKHLLALKARYNLTFACHNYFPPPKEDFVINLCSLDSTIFKRSLAQLKKSILFSYHLGARHFGFHAGFFLPLSPKELGSTTTKRHRIYDKFKCIQRFIEGYHILDAYARKYNIQLYLENNVISAELCAQYGNADLAMLLCYDDYLSLKEQIECALLLDIGHLKVSSKTLGKDFTTESKQCFAIAQYIHISDNNGLRDENKPIATTSEFLPTLAATHNRNRIYTLEVYSGLEDVRASYEILQGCIAIS